MPYAFYELNLVAQVVLRKKGKRSIVNIMTEITRSQQQQETKHAICQKKIKYRLTFDKKKKKY